jgi:hypothetical protein
MSFKEAQTRSEPSSHVPGPLSKPQEPEMSQTCKALLSLSWINMMQHGTAPKYLELDG